MTDIAHAAIDAGADIVVGHGPHYSLPIEVYRGKPIFTGSATSRSIPATADANTAIGSAPWSGRPLAGRGSSGSRFSSCATTTATRPCLAIWAKEADELADIVARSTPYGTKFVAEGNEVRVELDHI